MEVKAVARTIRVAPRRVRLVLDSIEGKNVTEAITTLKLANKASSPVIEGVLMFALTNAEYNYNMNTDELIVRETYTNERPTLRRLHPRAQGCASAINKRTSHVTIVVNDGKEGAEEA